jgi:hypothetical protein
MGRDMEFCTWEAYKEIDKCRTKTILYVKSCTEMFEVMLCLNVP